MSATLGPPADDWVPGLVALDIDGTLLKWVEGTGQHYEQVTEAVYDAVAAVVRATTCPVSSTLPQAWHSPHLPTQRTLVQPHSVQW